MCAGLIGETPDIAEAYRSAGSGGYGSDTGSESRARSLFRLVDGLIHCCRTIV